MHRHATIATAAFAAASVHAQTVTVTTVDDVTDFPAPQTVAQLPGPDGRVSFREACLAASNTPGPQTIAFAIPQSDWWLYTDRALLRQEFGVFFISDDDTTIDFTTQQAFTGNTNPAGNEVAIYGLEPNAWGVQAIDVGADNCLIKGLDQVQQRGYAIKLTGSNNRVIGCTISGPLYSAVYISGGFGGAPASGNVVGGAAPGEGNVLSAGNCGVRIDTPAENNTVIGNRLSGSFSGVQVRGNPYTGSPRNNRVGGPTPAERNIIAGAGKYGEEGFPTGEQVEILMAVDTLVEGNYIGTNDAGTAPAPNQRGPIGVHVVDSTGSIIRNNLISGIRVVGVNHYAGQVFGDGVRVTGINAPTSDTLIEGNLIGTDASGLAAVPSLYGVRVEPLLFAQPITQTVVTGNTIAFNERDGVIVSIVSGVRVTANTIRNNGQLGIDLSPDGVNPNDLMDGDTGANGLQNFPTLQTAAAAGGAVQISGTFNSLPNQAFTLEFFASAACDPSGHGEGAQFLGAHTVTTDGGGNAPFAASLPASVAPGAVATATAIHLASGNTSEFSACIPITGGTCYPDCNADGSLTVADFGCFQTRLVGADPYADCNADGALTVADFGCFQTRFVTGCP